MKVHWVSPLSPEQTDIGRYAATVCEVLGQHCELTVWTHPSHCGPVSRLFKKRVYVVRPYHAMPDATEELNRADGIIYHLGNNARFHREILAMIARFPGLVILHDLSLFECMASVYREREGGDGLFLDLVCAEYGGAAVDAARRWLIADAPTRERMQLAEAYPMVRHALRGAWGVVTHTVPSGTCISELSGLLHWQLALPYPAEADFKDLSKLGRGASEEVDGELHILVFGYIGGPNRRVAEVLQALAACPRRDRIQLHMAGAIQPNLGLEALVEELGLTTRVRMHGFVSENRLDRLIDESDVVINLRYPTRGEASGSLLRAWSRRTPVVVSRIGDYAELDDAAVWKITPGDEVKELCALWEQLLTDRSAIASKGRAGWLNLVKYHGIDIYVARLLEYVATSQDLRGGAIQPLLEERFALAAHDLGLPESVMRNSVERMGSELAGWFQNQRL